MMPSGGSVDQYAAIKLSVRVFHSLRLVATPFINVELHASIRVVTVYARPGVGWVLAISIIYSHWRDQLNSKHFASDSPPCHTVFSRSHICPSLV